MVANRPLGRHLNSESILNSRNPNGGRLVSRTKNLIICSKQVGKFDVATIVGKKKIILMTEAERIRLLIHILRELRESHGITAEKLREAGQDVRRQITPAERLNVLDEIYNVREAEERYLRGEICE